MPADRADLERLQIAQQSRDAGARRGLAGLAQQQREAVVAGAPDDVLGARARAQRVDERAERGVADAEAVVAVDVREPVDLHARRARPAGRGGGCAAARRRAARGRPRCAAPRSACRGRGAAAPPRGRRCASGRLPARARAGRVRYERTSRWSSARRARSMSALARRTMRRRVAVLAERARPSALRARRARSRRMTAISRTALIVYSTRHVLDRLVQPREVLRRVLDPQLEGVESLGLQADEAGSGVVCVHDAKPLSTGVTSQFGLHEARGSVSPRAHLSSGRLRCILAAAEGQYVRANRPVVAHAGRRVEQRWSAAQGEGGPEI